MVKGEDSQLSGCGFEPRRHILDGVSKASYYIGKREIKVAKWSTPKKIFKKTKFIGSKKFAMFYFTSFHHKHPVKGQTEL